LSEYRNQGRILDRIYIPTRYPNGLPDIIPSEAYSETDADTAMKIADEFLSCAEKFRVNLPD